MKKATILLQCLISVLLLSCSKEETPNLPEIEPGEFHGYIGRHGYILTNDNFNKRTTTTYFDGANIQFKFDSYSSPTIIDGSIFDVNLILTVNLVNPLNTPSFLDFDTYNGTKNYTKNWITVNWFEQWREQKTVNLYTTIKEKQSIRADILSVNYMELKVPSLEVKIKGYLYNIDNKQDSILIDATFITQASY